MATVGQVLDEIEDYLRSRLKPNGFSDKCQLMDVTAIKGKFSGKASEDGKTWYKFVIANTYTKVLPI